VTPLQHGTGNSSKRLGPRKTDRSILDSTLLSGRGGKDKVVVVHLTPGGTSADLIPQEEGNTTRIDADFVEPQLQS
jgi:hypothetical protein